MGNNKNTLYADNNRINYNHNCGLEMIMNNKCAARKNKARSEGLTRPARLERSGIFCFCAAARKEYKKHVHGTLIWPCLGQFSKFLKISKTLKFKNPFSKKIKLTCLKRYSNDFLAKIMCRYHRRMH